MEGRYDLLIVPVGEVGDCRGRPLQHSLGDGCVSLHTDTEAGGSQPWAWTTWTCSTLRKVKLYGLLVGLMATLLIMASYVLTGERRGLLLTPSPYHLQTVDPALHLVNRSSRGDDASIKQVVQNIVEKVEFSQRKVPDLQELMEREPHIFSVIPRNFLPYIKNPCWYEEHSRNDTMDPYKTNRYALYSRRFRAVYNYLRSAFQEHLHHEAGKQFRLRCLPYFYIIGQPKCGTTDLYDRLRLHPEVEFTTMKEPHWWTRKRFGIVRLNEGLHNPYPVRDYLDLFDLASYEIQDHLLGHGTGGDSKRSIIIGEASASTLWDNNAWVYFYDNEMDTEPPVLVQDFIHAVQPHARFIVMLRDPVERLYSDYLYFGMANKSLEDFHERVSDSLQLFQGCLVERSMRSCVYNTSLNNAMPVRLQVGLYVVYILDWLTIFNKEQLLILRLEDHAANRKHTMQRVFDFLHLGPLTKQKEADITKSPASNTRRPADKNLGPMLTITKEILQRFYQPFNQKLGKLLEDESFLWTSS